MVPKEKVYKVVLDIRINESVQKPKITNFKKTTMLNL